jgi:hypothetical protein
MAIVNKISHTAHNTYAVEFSTDFDDGTSLNTNNSETILSGSHLRPKRLAQFPGMDHSMLHQVHRWRVTQSGLRPKRVVADPESQIRSFKDSWKRDLQHRVRAGLAVYSANGTHARSTMKSVMKEFWKGVSPRNLSWKPYVPADSRKTLRAMGLPEAYPRHSATITNTRLPRLRIRYGFVGVLAASSAMVGMCMADLVQWTRTWRVSLLFTIMGFALIVSLLMAKIVRAGLCKHCGANLKPGQALCGLCGEGECPFCGYNLFGNKSGTCPECGIDLADLVSFVNKTKPGQPDANKRSKQNV